MTINQIIRIIATILLIACLCLACYEIGKSKAKIQIIEKEKEVIHYVEKKKAKIAAKPNASRDELIRMFNSGIL
jgi:hypothetical protein